jgi:UDPglucose 6-dehydrogenase
MARIGVFGAGYAGLVTGVGFAELGHTVLVRDVVAEKIAALAAGQAPFHEPGLEELLARNRERLHFTLDAAEVAGETDFFFICVGTPATYAGDADLSAVWTVLDELPRVDRRAILVMKSTVPVGTGEKVVAALGARGLDNVGYVSNPEFLSEGSAVRDFLEPDRIVIGAFDDADAEEVEQLHAGIDAPVVRADVASAEMIKLASNAFLGTRISFVNEIANVCELVGADVEQVARGMGLDRRIGEKYLHPGIGFGGSCLVGRETVLVRADGRTWLTRLDRLFSDLGGNEAGATAVVEPAGLEVLSWREGSETAEFLPVSAVTRREFEGDVVEVRTKMGRRLRCTPDHPFVVRGSKAQEPHIKVAHDLTASDWLPVARHCRSGRAEELPDVLAGLLAADLQAEEVIARPPRGALAAIGAREVAAGIAPLEHPRQRARSHDIVGSGALRLSELRLLGLEQADSSFGTAKNGTYVPAALRADERFWRVVGLYVAEGHCTVDGRRHRLFWSFHPTDESDLVEEVAGFWREHGVKTSVRRTPTTMSVAITSRILAGWWLGILGLGRDCYAQRVPDLLWSQSHRSKRAFLGGLWRGDGSWSLLNGGPSVALEYGTVSLQLADGILRLLGDLGITASWKTGRTTKSTRDTHRLVVSGADQVEALLDLVSESDAKAITRSMAGQKKRIAPTGYRKWSPSASWVRVVGTEWRPHRGSVYSLEVPGAETFVSTGGLVAHNCFPKDISFLKLLAGNSGYHFQLLNSVIEVNELQKRRVVSKLEKHLGSLRGKTVALLGLSFKPNTDDLREAPSIVLASRLLAEGAYVRAWDPVVDPDERLKGVELAGSVLEAVRGAHAAVIVTEWGELRSLASRDVHAAMRNPLIIDGRNLLDPAAVRAAGFAYEGIGRPASPLEGLPEAAEQPDRASSRS